MPIELDIAEGSPAVAILAGADAMPADFLVMGTHGRSGFERLVLGSVTEKDYSSAHVATTGIQRGHRCDLPIPFLARYVLSQSAFGAMAPE